MKMKRRKKIEDPIIQNINIIKYNGDLYDVISQKRNATPDTYNRKLVKMHSLIFSRLLYLFLVATRHIKNSFAPIERVKQAQDEIRELIGLPIDIFRSKDNFNTNKKHIGVMYFDYDLDDIAKYPDLEDLILDLDKLANFCEEYHIDDIYIEKYYLDKYLSDKFIQNLTITYHSKILQHAESNTPSYYLIKTNPQELKTIISKLEESKYDNAFIYSLKDKLKNHEIINAINDFSRTNDGEILLKVVKQELSKIINEDSTIKDRIYGKVHQSFELADTFIRKTVTDQEGNYISQNIITLYNFLEVINYSHLEDMAFIESEEKELRLISLLYLHLLGEKLKERRRKIEMHSLYDYIYDNYKSTPSYKKIPWIKTLIQKRASEGPQYGMSLFSVALAYIFAALGVYIPNHWLPLNFETLDNYNNFINSIKHVYEESYEFEQDIKKSIQQYIEKVIPHNQEKEIEKSYQEEVKKSNKDAEDGKVAEIEWFTKEKMPLYFVDEYASSGSIYHGEFNFWMSSPIVDFWNMEDVRPLFQIKSPISKEELDKKLDNIYFHIPLEAYPVGDELNYILTEVIIKDESDPTKYLRIDSTWNDTHRAKLWGEEIEIIKSIQEPMIYYIYGISNEYESQIEIEGNYTKMNPEFIKEAILEGLDLDNNATNEEINQKIAEKTYTKYPKYTKKKDISELDYYREIASLDAIDIDLARVLNTMVYPNAMYVSGFKNDNNDNELTLDEAYTWVINEDGEIIDFLANFTGEKENKITSQNNEWLNYEEEKENSFASDEERDNKKSNYEFNEDKQEKLEEQDKQLEEDTEEEKESRVKEVLSAISDWAKAHHVSYYVAILIAMLIIKKVFGKKIKFNIQLAKANNILNDEDFAVIYTDLIEFVYGIKGDPIKRNRSKMLDTITKEFYAFTEEDIDSLIKEIKTTIKSNKELTSLKKVKELLQMLPFIIKNSSELEEYEQKELKLGGHHEK